MSKMHYLFICPNCRNEVLMLLTISNVEESIMLRYKCSEFNLKKEGEINLLQYLHFIQEEQSNQKGICHYMEHASKAGTIFCCVCSQWLCDECLHSHDQLYLNHVYSHYKINISSICPYHCSNPAAFFCEKCHEFFCKACNKKHKGHIIYTFDKYKKYISGKLHYPKFSEFESDYKQITNENKKLFKQRSEYLSGNILYEEKYSNYYQKIINHNKEIFSLYELVYWNYNVLNNKSWDIFNAMNIINQVQLIRTISFKDYCKQIVEDSVINSYPEFIPKYIPKRRFLGIKSETFTINCEEKIEVVFPLPENKLLLVTEYNLLIYDCKKEKVEATIMSMKIYQLREHKNKKDVINFLEKSNVLMLYIHNKDGTGYYFLDPTVPDYVQNLSLNILRFTDCVEIEKDLIVGVYNSFFYTAHGRIDYSQICKIKLVRESQPYLKKKNESATPQRIKGEKLFEIRTIEGVISIIHYHDDVFYLFTNIEYLTKGGLYSINLAEQNPKPNLLLEITETIKQTKKLNNNYFVIDFSYCILIYEFESLHSIFKYHFLNFYDLFYNDYFCGVFSDDQSNKVAVIDIKNNKDYPFIHCHFVLQGIPYGNYYKFSKNQIGSISYDGKSFSIIDIK